MDPFIRMSKSGKYTYIPSLRPRINLYRFLRDGWLTDVILKVGDASFTAHKIILSCHSCVFHSMFNTNMLEAQRNEVIITDVEKEVFSYFLDCLYTGVLSSNMPTLFYMELYICADKYQVTSLTTALVKMFKLRKFKKKAIELWLLADSFNVYGLDKPMLENIIYHSYEKMCRKSLSLFRGKREKMQQLMMKLYSHRIRKVLLGASYTARVVPKEDHVCPFVQQYNLMTFTCGVNRTERVDYSGFFAIFYNVRKIPSGKYYITISLFPTRNIGSPGDITIVCRINTMDDEHSWPQEDCPNWISRQFVWDGVHKHPTMGYRRIEVFHSQISADQYVAVEVGKQLPFLGFHNVRPWKIEAATSICSEQPNTDVESIIERSQQLTINDDYEGHTTRDEVFLICGKNPQLTIIVDKNHLLQRCYPSETMGIQDPEETFAWHKSNRIAMKNVSYETCLIVAKYVQSGIFPSRDKADLALLKLAFVLGLRDLVMYLEHALAWNIDPSNVIDDLIVADSLNLTFLKRFSVEYMVLHLPTVIAWSTDKWKNLSYKLLGDLVNGFPDNRAFLSYGLLPKFLTYENISLPRARFLNKKNVLGYKSSRNVCGNCEIPFLL